MREVRYTDDDGRRLTHAIDDMKNACIHRLDFGNFHICEMHSLVDCLHAGIIPCSMIDQRLVRQMDLIIEHEAQGCLNT